MRYLLDSSIAAHLLEGHTSILAQVELLDPRPALSAVTHVELESGVYRDPKLVALRRALLDELLETLPVLPFDDKTAGAYGWIVAQTGFARRKVLDRMIAAAAIVYDATLITTNGADFRDIPALKLEVWSAA